MQFPPLPSRDPEFQFELAEAPTATFTTYFSLQHQAITQALRGLGVT